MASTRRSTRCPHTSPEVSSPRGCSRGDGGAGTGSLQGGEIWLVLDSAPAYPAPARFARRDLALLGELEQNGMYRTALPGGDVTSSHRGVWWIEDARYDYVETPDGVRWLTGER